MSQEAFNKLKDDIQTFANLSSATSTGFAEVKCPICASQGKVRTGGFKFEHDKIIYNCFSASCEATCVYEYEQPISRRFRSLMGEYGVQIPVSLRAKKSQFQKEMERVLRSEMYEEHKYESIPTPRGWIPLTEEHGEWYQHFIKRRCDPSDILYIPNGQYAGCAAIPMKHKTSTIGFQIATLYGSTKYITHTSEHNDNLIYINGGWIGKDIILVEGILDAKCFPNTVAIMKGNISPKQAYFLAGRQVSVIPDRHSGDKLLEQAKLYGWNVIIPQWKDVGDLNDCVVKYGKLLTAKMIVDRRFTDYTKAHIAYKIWKER